MSEQIGKIYRPILCAVLLLLTAAQARAGVVPPASLIISLGASRITMKPEKDSAVHALSMNNPGLYVKFSGENYINNQKFVHVDLNMSFSSGTMESGTVKESRLCFNYGVGWCFERVKLIVSPGFCYSSIAYQNNALNKSISDTRFAPSLGLQTDLILMKSRYRYLAIFIEASAMAAKPSRWVQQLAVGINWKPSFRKEIPPVVLPN